MAGVFTYSAVITKLRAKYSMLLTKEDYDILMSQQSVTEIVQWLRKNSQYQDMLSSISENDIHRGDIERVFWDSLYKDAEGLKKMLRSKEKQMLEVFLSRQEIDLLKQEVRRIISQENSEYEDSLIYSWHGAKDLNELANKLKGTVYHESIKRFTEIEDVNAFEIEKTLDEIYFRRVKEAAKKYLSKADAKNILDFISAEVDVYNLLNTYRYKKYYGLEGNELLVNLIPNKRKLKKTELERIAGADISSFVNVIRKTGYAGLFEKKSEKEWDISIQEFLCRLYKKHLRQNAFSFTTILAYFYLKEMAIRNVITIIEGVRYGLEPATINRYLVKIK